MIVKTDGSFAALIKCREMGKSLAASHQEAGPVRGEAAGRGCRLAGRVEAAAAVQSLQELGSVRGHRHLGRQVALVVACNNSIVY